MPARLSMRMFMRLPICMSEPNSSDLALIVMDHIGMPYTVMAHIVMAYIVMAYIVMAHRVMAI